MAVRQHDSPELRRLTAEWNRRLYEDGFVDVETAGPDGPLHDLVSNAGARCSSPEALEACAGATMQLALALGAHQEAREALYRPEIWRGLPPRARRWWALQVLGLSYTRARRLAGVPQHRAERWRRLILARIEGIRRSETDDDG